MDRAVVSTTLVVFNVALVCGPPNLDGSSEHVSLVGSSSCLVKEFSFMATVTDSKGKKCRGKVTSKACFGLCESSETGTFRFPWLVRVQPVCNYDRVVNRIVRLRHCERGADRRAAFYRFPEAQSCSCERCDPKRQHCQPAPTTLTTAPPQGHSNDKPLPPA